MSIPFNTAHYKRKGRKRDDPLYHGDECELLYHQIAALKIQCKLHADLLKNDKPKSNLNMFHWLIEQVECLKARYEIAYLRSAVPEKRCSDITIHSRLNWLEKKYGIK